MGDGTRPSALAVLSAGQIYLHGCANQSEISDVVLKITFQNKFEIMLRQICLQLWAPVISF